MATATFNPDEPTERPLPALPPMLSDVWDRSALRRFVLATDQHPRPRSPAPFIATIDADALLDAGAELDTLLAAGCTELRVAFGSLGPHGDARGEQLAALVGQLRDRGVRVHGSFTLGFDHDDEGCFERLVAWIEAQRIAEVELRLWTPEPGGVLTRALAREDRIRHWDLNRWDGAHVIVSPARMSAQTLYRGWAWARRRLGSLRSIWRRRPDGLLASLRYAMTTKRLLAVSRG